MLSRVTSIFEEHGVENSAQERFIAETFCTRAARRVDRALNRLHDNDDDSMHQSPDWHTRRLLRLRSYED